MNPREFLASLEFHGVKLGLDNIRCLLEAADEPHRRYPAVHVAGTNGKGSVVAILDAMLRASGYRTGRFTSPHLIHLDERFLVDGRPLDEAALDRHIAFFQNAATRLDTPPTYFELCTAVAFRSFAEAQVDVAVIEVGMGGRLDSTNVITPVVAAITNIDFDHTQYLGDTLDAIAFEKAGIIKSGVPVVVAEQKTGPRAVILDRAREMHSPVSLLGRDFRYSLGGGSPWSQEIAYEGGAFRFGPTPLALPGRYQGENAAVAVAMAERLHERFPRLTLETVGAGLKTARWPCRLEKVLDAPPVIVDVAHNPAGIARLAAELPPCVVVLAVSSDKAASRMIAAVAPVARELVLTQFSGSRALPVDALCAAAGSLPHHRVDNLPEALELGMALASTSLPLVVSGSIFTAGQARRILIDRHGAPPLQF